MADNEGDNGGGEVDLRAAGHPLSDHIAIANAIETLCREAIDKHGVEPGSVMAGLMLAASTAAQNMYGPMTGARWFEEQSKVLRRLAAADPVH